MSVSGVVVQIAALSSHLRDRRVEFPMLAAASPGPVARPEPWLGATEMQ